MTTALAGAVELLDRSLSYTRVALAGVDEAHLDRRTPCRGWTLRALLAHMDDGLDAFTEAAGGSVPIERPPGELRVESLQRKACALLGIWSTPTTHPDVRVGDADLATDLLISTAALEITVHGWDVGQATGKGGPIPEGLARALLPVAHQVVDDADRGIRFGSPGPVSDAASYDERLRAFLGRPD